MKDTIIKGSGNSRLIKTVPNAATLWPTHEALMQEWATNGLPIDLLGLVAAGVQQAGMDLNKANMLTDATEQAIWGSAADRTPDAALKQLRSLITTVQNSLGDKLQCETGSYKVPAAGGPVTLTFSLKWKLFIVAGPRASTGGIWGMGICFRPPGLNYGTGYYDTYSNSFNYIPGFAVEDATDTGGSIKHANLTVFNQTYYYIALGPV